MHLKIDLKPAQTEPQEWLATNGLGGFASGVVSGPSNRRYHGLLCASLNPPTQRVMLCSHIVEQIEFCGQSHYLSCEHYQHHRPLPALFPNAFNPAPFPVWEFEAEGFRLTKSLAMQPGQNTTLIRYFNAGNQPFTLRLRPLLSLRDYHALRTGPSVTELTQNQNRLTIHTPGLPAVHVSASHGQWSELNDWYHELYYAEEAARGFEATEEAYAPAELSVTLAPKAYCVLRLSTEADGSSTEGFEVLAKKYHTLAKTDEWCRSIVWAADQFIVDRASTKGKTILAGYPWFTDWGRDTLIALRDFQDFMSADDARGIIKTFLAYEKDGLIPNRFPDNPNQALEYNTADATLWLFVALWELQKKSANKKFLKQVFPTLTKILQHHLKGTHFNIGVQADGLLTAGQAPWQLTWMDARIGDYSVTPRMGCPVEINMLWYNALKIYAAFATELKDHSLPVTTAISKFEKNFAKHFWNPTQQGLRDVVAPAGQTDDSIRPNQIYALSLPFTVLSLARQKQVLAQVKKHLYTPLGLRSLSPHDPQFKNVYTGDTWQRDTAYHQGTVWLFLLREYWVAYEKVYGTKPMQSALQPELATLKHHWYNDAGLQSASEIFDGGHPQHGKGTPQQAWSVAAVWKLVQMLQKQPLKPCLTTSLVRQI